MDIRQGLENLQWHSKAARHLLTDIIDKLDELDGMDLITPSTKEETDELINRKDNATVGLYNCLQGFLNLLEWYREELDKLYSIEKALKLKLIQNDKDSDEVIKRCVKIYGSMFNETYYPETWNKEDFTVKTHSLTTDLKNRISNRLMREDEIPEFKERMVDYGANKDLISNEPMTRQKADRIASNLVYWIDYYLSNVCRCQKSIANILDEGYSLRYPNTSTEQEQTIKRSPITDEKGIKIAFDLAEKKGLMRLEGIYYRWLADNALLAYFCERLYNLFLSMTKGNKSWGYFSNWFIVKGKDGKDIIPNGAKLNRYKTDWKADRLLDSEDPFCPDGDKIIDEIILSAKK